MLMLGVLARFLRRSAAACHALQGRLAWRCGFARRARHHFERALALGGSEFIAYVHLGRIALGEGDFAGYRREMSNARACDPDRFAKLAIPTEGLQPRTSGNPSEETGERATWRSVRPQGPYPRRPAVRSAELPTDLSSDDMRLGQLDSSLFGLDEGALDDSGAEDSVASPRRSRRDDFESTDERQRFAELPPIRHADLEDLDLDELSRRLIS